MKNQPYLIELNKLGSPNLGYISILEEEDGVIPFKIKRTYWTYFTPNHVERGAHAHKELQQIIVAVSGIIEFKLEDKNRNTFHFTLDEPNKALYIPKGYWRDIKFSHNAVLLCLASETYNEDDYIRNYNDFKNLSK